MSSKDKKLIEYALGSSEYIDQFIPIIKSELIANGKLDDLIDQLESVSMEQESELQNIAFGSIDDILDCVSVIHTIDDSCDNLGKKVSSINKSLNKSGKLLLEEKRKILNIKQTRQRIEDTNAKINSCLEVLDLINKISGLIKTEDFYRALILLKSLRQNRHTDAYTFVDKFYNSIPSFKMLIVDETFNQLNKWLNLSIEKNLVEFGELIFDNFNNINNNWFHKQNKNLDLISYKVNTPVELSFRSSELLYFDPLNALNVELQPFYHSILVFKELNQMNELKEYFANDMVRRVDHLFIPIKDSISKLKVFSSNESLRINLFSVCSFSIIDKIINERTNFQIRKIDEINNTFNSIQKNLLPILRNHVEYYEFDDLDDFVGLNDILGNYYQILTYHNFNAEPVYKILLKLFNKFVSKLVDNFRKHYSLLSLQDNAQSIIVENIRDYNEISKDVFSEIPNEEKFPTSLPFSAIYLDTCQLLRQFISDIYTFVSRYYTNDINLIIGKIGKSIDDILSNIVLKDLDDKIKSTYKEVVSQNLINLDFYLKSIPEIENYLNSSNDLIIMRTRVSSNLIKLSSISNFQKTRRLAIESMFTLIDSKIHSLFDMVDFEWDTDEVKSTPNTSLIDMIEFLQGSFRLNFSHLPESVKSLLLLKILDKISKFLNDSILETNYVTEASVNNFSKDLTYIKNSIVRFFDNDSEVSESSLESLKNLFLKSEQIVNLLNEGNLENYKIDEIRYRQFNKIEKDEAVTLIRKLRVEIEELDDISDVVSMVDTLQDDTKSIFGLKRSGTFKFSRS
ncbi:hypothetical protein CANINC_002374 [Pichia inconspicua]|uniref:Exocyst complex component SEC15 n=1 Tax=Pichia inconspicua TaxID=52247 RepID=A0A4T0X199_9ASCO|nr:hypothetical protein CANINC_002374 [[Candida] inconspicua]